MNTRDLHIMLFALAFSALFLIALNVVKAHSDDVDKQDYDEEDLP